MIAEDLKYHTQHFLSDNREILFISHSSKNSHHSEIKKRTIEQCRKIVRFLDENQIHYAVVPNNFAYLFYFDGDDVKEFGFTVNRHKMSVDDFIEYLMIEMKTLKKNGITFWKIDVVNDNIWFKLHPEKAISYYDLPNENGSISRQKYDPDNFDEKYYKEMSITDSFSLLRPLTRGFTESHRFLTSNCSVTVFGFEFWKRLDELRKKFKPVYGYDINELAIREADKNGYEGFVELQDVIEDFEPAFPKTDISICFYLLEHLDDSQCRKVLDNMIKTSPVNFVVVTSNEE